MRRDHQRSEEEPPGDPRTIPWPQPAEPVVPEPGEAPGEPREVPYPEPQEEPEPDGAARVETIAPRSEPPGDPREAPWPRVAGLFDRLRGRT